MLSFVRRHALAVPRAGTPAGGSGSHRIRVDGSQRIPPLRQCVQGHRCLQGVCGVLGNEDEGIRSQGRREDPRQGVASVRSGSNRQRFPRRHGGPSAGVRFGPEGTIRRTGSQRRSVVDCTVCGRLVERESKRPDDSFGGRCGHRCIVAGTAENAGWKDDVLDAGKTSRIVRAVVPHQRQGKQSPGCPPRHSLQTRRRRGSVHLLRCTPRHRSIHGTNDVASEHPHGIGARALPGRLRGCFRKGIVQGQVASNHTVRLGGIAQGFVRDLRFEAVALWRGQHIRYKPGLVLFQLQKLERWVPRKSR
mmetsp:Transcript_17505/g.38284  ORF Transcript_17505/g.38284 Transcript_17505/m.38284 type:complete len:305 (-) Transcript_17505:250-1164(-)